MTSGLQPSESRDIGSELRICLISHAYVEPGYLPVLQALAAQPGVTLSLITPTYFKQGAYTSTGNFSSTDTEYSYYPVRIRWGGRQGAFFYNQAALGLALDTIQPQIILHEQEVFAIGAGQIAAVASARKIPLVNFVWENIDRELSVPRIWLRNYVMGHCAGLLVGSVRTGEVHRGWGFEGPIEVIPQMGVNRLNPAPALGRRGTDRLEICYVGRLTAYKGIDCLLRALALTKRRGVGVRGTIAGRGEQLDELKALAAELELGDTVVFAGLLQPPEVIGLFQRSDALVLPSRKTKVWEEQFGRVLVEAMAEATVPIGTRTGAIAEVIGDEELLFDEDDVEQLAGILERLASDEGYLRSKQMPMWERARDHYLHSVLMARKVKFFRRVLGMGEPS